MKKTKPFIWVTFFFTFFLTQVSLKAQAPIILDSKMKPGIYNDMRIEELKVRWKKSALENCPGVPCVTNSVPGAPTAVVATAGNASASVAFVAPINNGGSVVTGYTVTSNPGSFIGTGTTSPINVTGLTNGTAYTFTVVATNAVGNSVASAASTAVTPAVPNTVPGAPTAVVATAGNASASVAFVAPINNGGSVVTGYTVTSNPGSFIGTGTTSPINVTGLTNGTAYTFTVVATNAVGNSVASAASTAVTPAVPNTVPGAPTAVVATAGNASARVAFVAPTNNGGSVVTGYTVTSNPGSFIGTGITSPINVTGLTNGTAYTFTVVATNAMGNSVASAASTAVTPLVVCPTSTVTDVDGNIYNTVAIGTQCWTKENLKVTKYNDGVTPIPDETANTGGWGSLATGARSEYVAAGVTGYVSTYGYLYNWYAAAGIFSTVPGTTPKNICPDTWRVPTETDWTNLRNYIGTSPGTRLRENSTLWDINLAFTGTDEFGFSARPGGWRNFASWFRFIGTDAFFWTATYDVANNSAVSVAIDGNQDNVFIGAGFQLAKEGFSVRCLKN